MAQCVSVQNGYIKATSSACDYVLVTSAEIQKIVENPTDNLTIDSDLYTTLSGHMLLSFIVGHCLGRIAKTLGRR